MTTVQVEAGYRGGAVVAAMVVLLTLVVTTPTASSAPQPNDDNNSEVYLHSSDDVFEASQAVLKNMRMSVDQADRGAGRIVGKGKYVQNRSYVKLAFNIRIESIGRKSETRVTVDAKSKGFNFGLGGGYARAFIREFLTTLQKALAVSRRPESASYQRVLYVGLG